MEATKNVELIEEEVSCSESSDEEETCEKDEVIHILKSSLLGSVCI